MANLNLDPNCRLKRTKPEPVITLGKTTKEVLNTEDAEAFWNQHCWKVSDAFFAEHGIVQQQIDSYNRFLDYSVKKIIGELPVIDIQADGVRYEFRFRPDTVTISKPTYVERDAKVSTVYPNDARLRNLTYASNIYCRIEATKKLQGKTEECLDKETNKLRLIGKVPVMVRSNCCSLKGLTDSQLQQLNECPLDPGGYFIVNGKERVIIAQERAANNRLFVFPRGTASKTILECEIRSIVENSSAAAHAFWVVLEPARKVAKNLDTLSRKMLTPKIKARFPSLNVAIDVIILFQILGFKSDYDILRNIVSLDNSERSEKENSEFMPILRATFQVKRCLSVLSAKENLAQHIKIEMNEDDKIPYIDHLLTREFLPHLGTEPSDFKKKGYFLALMIRHLLMVHVGLRPFDDRDHLQNKRYYFAGPMIGQIFYRGLRIMHSDLKRSLEIQMGRSRNSSFSLDKALNCTAVSRFVAHCISTGIWGDKRRIGSHIYKAVSQELNRFTYASLISSLRRINSPEDKLHLMVKPRHLHNTYFGMICPCETPEGKSVGLVKNLALQALITVGSSAETVKLFLLNECGVKEVMEVMNVTEAKKHNASVKPAKPYLKREPRRSSRLAKLAKPAIVIKRKKREEVCLHRKGKVFVNGEWIGFHEDPITLVKKLRQERRFGGGKFIAHEASIGWNTSAREIDIRVDAGRLTRPLMVVEDNKLKVTYDGIEKLSSGSYRWIDLLNNGLVEMIDLQETESTLIAMFPSKLKDDRETRKVEARAGRFYVNYTHLEIHPSLTLGVCAAVIPFSNHNQSPRNVYQSGIAKQSMGLYITNYASRMDTASHVLFYPQNPLSRTTPGKYTKFNELPAGVNCVVAIATYGGYNQEDSIILNRAALDRGLFRSTYYHTYSDKAERYAGHGEQGEEFHRPNLNTLGIRVCQGSSVSQQMIRYSNLDEDGVVSPGLRMSEDDCIIGKSMKIAIPNEVVEMGSGTPHKKGKPRNFLSRDVSTYLKKAGTVEPKKYPGEGSKLLKKLLEPESRAVVDRCLITTTEEGLRLIKVRIRNTTSPQIGDKFASLHGQKGVCGMVYREEDLLFTGNGIIPEIVINPHGLPSRMTIGQLYECLYGKAAALTGEAYDGTPFDPRDIASIQNVLTVNGFESQGNEVMYCGYTGRKLMTQIYIGPTYYQRLKHIVEDKIHSRGRGSVNILTRQPVQGFARDGGLRFGEMERDCVITHGSSQFLMERLLGVSDAYDMVICDKCGLLIGRRPVHPGAGKPYFRCDSCQKFQNAMEGISTIRLPYACKLLVQELMCMNISVKIAPRKLTYCEEYHDDPEDDSAANAFLEKYAKK